MLVDGVICKRRRGREKRKGDIHIAGLIHQQLLTEKVPASVTTRRRRSCISILIFDLLQRYLTGCLSGGHCTWLILWKCSYHPSVSEW